MSYVRESRPLIDVIETYADDLERELRYHQLTDESRAAGGRAANPTRPDRAALHHKSPWARARRPDMAQIRPWQEHYDLWLQERVRINRYKGAYLWSKGGGRLARADEAKRRKIAACPARLDQRHRCPRTWSACSPTSRPTMWRPTAGPCG
jgi:hypothetical protein